VNQPERLGRYTILGRLGAGAMGDVYLAEDPQIERRLAIKTVRVGGSESDLAERKQRLLREAKAAGKLIHPHVVTLFDYGEDQGLVFLAFEYVEGEDLRRRLDREPPLTVREALTLVRQTASALALAHEHAIVHRDIKPANILLTANGDAKVTDFGIAKMRDQVSDLTASGSIIGTPHYMSPEQIRGEPIDGRSDLFSLGSVLFEILHNGRPFQGESVTTVVYQILHHDPLDRGHVRADLPEPLRHLLARMLAKDREARFSDCGQVVRAIDQAFTELPEELLDAPVSGAPLEAATVVARPAVPPPGPAAAAPNATAAPRPPVAAPPPVAAASAPPSAPPPTAPAAPLAAAPAAVPSAPLAGVASTGAPTGVAGSRRPKVWAVLGCIALPLLIGAGALALLAPRVISWVEEQRAVLTAENGAPAPVADEASDPGAALDDGSPGGGDRLDPDAADEAPIVVITESERPEASEADPAKGAAEGGGAPGSLPRAADTTPSNDQGTGPRAADPPRPTPASPRRTSPPAEPRPTQPAEPEPEPAPAEPEPTEPEPADQPVPEAIPFDSELQTSLQLSFAVEPETAFVLLRSPFDQRFTNIGQADDFDASKRRRAPFALPGAGVFYVMLRAEGYGDHVVKVTADPRRPAPTTISLRMGRPGQGASGGSALASAIQVREGITFGEGPPRAKVEVDGREAGVLRRYQEGRLLPLAAGRHRVAVTLGTRRTEVDVEVSSSTPSARQVVEVGGGR
jgi:eukaryotic-like serine/threonine-protein kinase